MNGYGKFTKGPRLWLAVRNIKTALPGFLFADFDKTQSANFFILHALGFVNGFNVFFHQAGNGYQTGFGMVEYLIAMATGGNKGCSIVHHGLIGILHPAKQGGKACNLQRFLVGAVFGLVLQGLDIGCHKIDLAVETLL